VVCFRMFNPIHTLKYERIAQGKNRKDSKKRRVVVCLTTVLYRYHFNMRTSGML
jgi:hypothetical protein